MLNNNQKTFCQEYVNNSENATQAYLKAYKTCKKEETAKVNASRLLTNANILEYIKELQQKLEDKSIMTAKARMKWLTDVINGDIKEKTTVLKTDSEGNSELIEQEFPSKLDTKLKALDTLNKMSGEYTTKIEGNVGIVKLEDVL